ncbi:MAG: pantetheine-phosphate adenylyltransferase [Bauldia sp.]
MARVALFPGSFDPMTNGHVDVLRAALEIADTVVLAIGIHPQKSPFFSVEERTAMLEDIVGGLDPAIRKRVSVMSFGGLLTDAARSSGATVIVRGIRDSSDVDSELRMAAMNAVTAPEIHTVFVAASPMNRHISATLVRQITEMKGDPSPFVPPQVAARLAKRGARMGG